MLAWPTPEVGLILLLLEECCDLVGVRQPVDRDRLFLPFSNVEAWIWRLCEVVVVNAGRSMICIIF